MKRILCVLALLAATIAPADARAAVCAPPRCVETSVPVPAGLKVPDNHIRVVLPARYADDVSKRYPVLYLLHGAGDTFRTWIERTDVIDLTRALDLIVVFPDGGRNADAGWYSDWADGSRNWETFHTRDLVEFVDATYRTLGDGHRAVAGLSMGGFGAVHYAARHPGEFAAAASFSGALDTMHAAPVSGVAFRVMHDNFGTPDDRIWGNQVTEEAVWRQNNPTDLAAKLGGVKLFIATGNGTPGGAHEEPGNPGGYVLENGIWQMNLNFVRALDTAGVPHTDLFYGPGNHSWPYWRDALAWALPQMLSAIS